MKAFPKKLLPLILIGIAVTSLFSVQPAQAFTITLEQMGANVVATGSGAINLTGLTFSNTSGAGAGIVANLGDVIMTSGNSDLYRGFTGPTNFGSGGPFGTNTFSGDSVGISPDLGLLGVPLGYVSGAALSDSMTFNNETLASLGVTPGTYVWTWGTGLPNQNFTLIIGGAGVPDGGSTVSLLGCALLGLAALRRKSKTFILAAVRCSLMFAAVAALSIACPAKANLITNGDFETGTLAGWTTTPAPIGSSFGVLQLPLPHNTLGAFFAADGPDFDSISQTFVTTPGAFYNLSFFYQVETAGQSPDNGLRVFFNGVLVFENLNAISGFGTFPFNHLQATGSTTTVEFQGRNVPGFDYIDDISVVGVPDGGSTVSLLGFALLGLAASRRKLSW